VSVIASADTANGDYLEPEEITAAYSVGEGQEPAPTDGDINGDPAELTEGETGEPTDETVGQIATPSDLPPMETQTTTPAVLRVLSVPIAPLVFTTYAACKPKPKQQAVTL